MLPLFLLAALPAATAFGGDLSSPVADCASPESLTVYSYHVHFMHFKDLAEANALQERFYLRFQSYFNASSFDPESPLVKYHKCGAEDPTCCPFWYNDLASGFPSICNFGVQYDYDPMQFGPFFAPQSAFLVPSHLLDEVFMWVLKNVGSEAVYVHANTGCQAYDHINPVYLTPPYRIVEENNRTTGFWDSEHPENDIYIDALGVACNTPDSGCPDLNCALTDAEGSCACCVDQAGDEDPTGALSSPNGAEGFLGALADLEKKL